LKSRKFLLVPWTCLSRRSSSACSLDLFEQTQISLFAGVVWLPTAFLPFLWSSLPVLLTRLKPCHILLGLGEHLRQNYFSTAQHLQRNLLAVDLSEAWHHTLPTTDCSTIIMDSSRIPTYFAFLTGYLYLVWSESTFQLLRSTGLRGMLEMYT